MVVLPIEVARCQFLTPGIQRSFNMPHGVEVSYQYHSGAALDSQFSHDGAVCFHNGRAQTSE